MSHIHQYFHQALFFALHVQGPHDTHTEMMDLPPLISLDLFMMWKACQCCVSMMKVF